MSTANFFKQLEDSSDLPGYIFNILVEREKGFPANYDLFNFYLQSYAANQTDGTSRPLSDFSLRILQQILETLEKNIYFISKENFKLVDSLLSLHWIIQENSIRQSYLSLLQNIVSAHPFFIVCIISTLIRSLRKDNLEIVNDIHSTMKILSQNVPAVITFIGPALTEHWPHRCFPLEQQRAYISNALLISDYIPSLKSVIFEICVEKIMLIDFDIFDDLDNLTEEELLSLEECTEMVSDDDGNGNGNGNVDDYSDIETDMEDIEFVQPRSKKLLELIESISKMDSMLHIFLSHLSSLHTQYENQLIAEKKLRAIFVSMIRIFDKLILPSFKLRYTQFLVFYMTSFSADFPDIFLGFLVDKLWSMDESCKTDYRLMAISLYIGSYVARCKFLNENLIVTCFEVLLSWAGRYMTANSHTNDTSNPTKHCTFYSAVQSIMYIFCFRHNILLSQPAKKIRYKAMLDSIITSALNPLAFCVKHVVDEFAKITSQYELVFCYSFIHRNKRTASLTNSSPITPCGTPPPTEELESFFPFDPFKLKHSSEFLTDDLYLEWDDVNADELEEIIEAPENQPIKSVSDSANLWDYQK